MGAKPRTTTKGSREKPPRADHYDHLTITERDVVVLQVEPHSSFSELEDLVFRAFWEGRDERPPGTEWMAYGRSEMPHYLGKSSWVAFSKSVPIPLLDAVQGVIVSAGMGVERETGRALQNRLLPFARLSDDGLEIMVPAALVGDPHERRVVPRGGAAPIARGYVLSP